MAQQGRLPRPRGADDADELAAADGDVDAVPVLERGRIIGIVTRTDLIGALARTSLR